MNNTMICDVRSEPYSILIYECFQWPTHFIKNLGHFFAEKVEVKYVKNNRESFSAFEKHCALSEKV